MFRKSPEIPCLLTRRNYQVHVEPVDAELLSQPEDAVRRFEDAGGYLTHFSNFWKDPPEVHVRPHLNAERERVFYECFPDVGPFFHALVNGDRSLFKDGLTYMYFIAIHVTARLHGMIQVHIFAHIHMYMYMYMYVPLLGNKQFSYDLHGTLIYTTVQVFSEILPWYIY